MFFFFQAEDGIRDYKVTGVQTCALPILRHEWVLGVGGVRVLRALGYDPAAWHANEGHAAFMLVERVRELVTRGTPFAEAVRKVRAASTFTTHTPVPAGHDTFSIEQVEQ